MNREWGCEHRGKRRQNCSFKEPPPNEGDAFFLWYWLNGCSKMAQTINSIYFTWRAPGDVHCSFGLGFCMLLRMGNGRRAVETHQCRGARLGARSCLKATQAPFRRKTQYPQKLKCSAWNDLGVSWDPRKARCWRGIAMAMPLEGSLLVQQHEEDAFYVARIPGHMTSARAYEGHCTWVRACPLPCSLHWAGASGSAPSPQPQRGSLLRRQAADETLECRCWWETLKTESQTSLFRHEGSKTWRNGRTCPVPYYLFQDDWPLKPVLFHKAPQAHFWAP